MEQPGTIHRQTIEQLRGRRAWLAIREIKDIKKADLEQEYRSQARGLNTMIQVNGLGQTLGFLFAKGQKEWREKKEKNAHFYLLGHLTHWLHDHFNSAIADFTDNKSDGIIEWITETANSTDYRRAATECLAFGNWLRRFAEAELEDKKGKGRSNG